MLTAGTLAALVIVYVAWGAWRDVARIGRKKRLSGVLDKVVSSISEPSRLLEELSPLARSEQIEVLEQIAHLLTGGLAAGLSGFADRSHHLDTALQEVSGRCWWRRLRAARLLSALGTDRPDKVDQALGDPHPLVRAQAAFWAGRHPTSDHVERLFGLLGDEVRLCRVAAEDTLSRLGPGLVPALKRRLASGFGLEVLGPLRVAISQPNVAFYAEGLHLSRDPDSRVRALAARLLGVIGGEGSMRRLTDLVADPAPEVRQRAIAGLGRIGDRQVASILTERLADPAWDVRKEAALALKGMGAVGALFLREARTHRDPFAADMARMVLE